jgi:hypothetical protein
MFDAFGQGYCLQGVDGKMSGLTGLSTLNQLRLLENLHDFLMSFLMQRPEHKPTTNPTSSLLLHYLSCQRCSLSTYSTNEYSHAPPQSFH